MSTTPKALELAKYLEQTGRNYQDHETAAELRRQHGEIEGLRAQVEALTGQIEASNTTMLQAAGHMVKQVNREIDRALTRPAVTETEVHEPKCPALDGGYCICSRSDKHNEAVDRSWARYCAKFGDSPDAPYPGMISAFERYYSQSFADKEWRTESSVWAAAWKAALLAADPQRKLDDLEIKNASLESEVFHLSTLCDEQRAILIDVEKEFGTDAHGIEFEDGDSKLIDRVRDHLAMLTQPKPEVQPTEAAQKGGE